MMNDEFCDTIHHLSFIIHHSSFIIHHSITMKEVEIQQKIDTTLSSLDGITQAEVDASLFESILRRIETRQLSIDMIPMRTVWLAAACFGLIIWVNITCLVLKRHHQQQESAASAIIARTYLNSKG
jgi:hypothetical protein